MKFYNINIDTSTPVNQTVQMQQSATGLLNLNVTNGGKYIRNLTTKVYDGGVEVPSTEKGFKIGVGTEPKHVKVVAKSTPMESTKEVITSYTPFNRTIQVQLTRLVLPVGTYTQDEFLPLLSQVPSNNYFQVVWSKYSGSANIDRILFATKNPLQKIWFYNLGEHLEPDEPIIVTEEITFKGQVAIKGKNPVIESETYPAIGYWSDYQMDALVNPAVNAPYDGNYVESLKEVEVDGVKFVPTTLAVDGVEYKVLAEAVDSTDSEVTDGDGE